MRTATRSWVAVCGIFAVIASFTITDKAQAASFDESMTAVSASLPLGADVGAMGNVGTLEEFSSNNPAISSIMGEGNVSGTANYGYFKFAKSNLQTVSASITKKIGPAALQVAVGHGETPTSNIGEFETFRIKESNTLNLQLGGEVASGMIGNDVLYAGLGYTYGQSTQKGSFPVLVEEEFFISKYSSETKSHGATVGAAYKPIKEVTIGAFATRTWNRSEFTMDGVEGSEVSKSFSDIHHLGFAYKIFEGTTLAGDYQQVRFSNSSTKFNQYFVGVEQYVVKDIVALYAGIANEAPTAGIGVYFTNGGLNLSYGHNMLRETKAYLGSCDAYMASTYFNF